MLAWLLLPISRLFQVVVQLRACLYKVGILQVHEFAVPVIVVGNISVGGTGKTPVVSALVKRCQLLGKKPGVVSRGYGAAPAKHPRMIDSNTPVDQSGDEPLQLALETGVPVCIATDRSAAVNWLVENGDIDVVISDDGMQHYAMHRDAEIAVVDGQRLLGNQWLLPAGPLRESPKRLRQVDLIAIQQAKSANQANRAELMVALKLDGSSAVGQFYLEIEMLTNLADQQTTKIESFRGQQIHAMAGVGNPSRFFASLRSHGIDVIEHAMPDHHRYQANDIAFNDQHPILITSKDAVKIRALNVDLGRIYEVSVSARFDSKLDQAIDQMIARLF